MAKVCHRICEYFIIRNVNLESHAVNTGSEVTDNLILKLQIGMATVNFNLFRFPWKTLVLHAHEARFKQRVYYIGICAVHFTCL